jgi:hypothetical protein
MYVLPVAAGLSACGSCFVFLEVPRHQVFEYLGTHSLKFCVSVFDMHKRALHMHSKALNVQCMHDAFVASHV